MVKLIWAPKAIRILDNILDYISMDSEKYASLVIRDIIDLAETIPSFPVSGRIVFENVNERIEI